MYASFIMVTNVKSFVIQRGELWFQHNNPMSLIISDRGIPNIRIASFTTGN